MTKVSIIVPIYNMELYLKECLDSILSQTLKEIEVVCIDDGSTDRSSVRKIREFRQQGITELKRLPVNI